MNRNIIIAGGGTGGHIFPAVAIANALKKQDPDINILFIGAKGKMEMEKVPEAGYEIKGLDIAGYNRSSPIRNIGLPFKILKSFIQVSSIFKTFRPDAVLGVGGYSTFPVLRYAQSKRIPTFIHESNSFAGRANIMLSRKATKIFTGSDGMEKFFPQKKLVVTGNPIRAMIARNTASREAAARLFGLDAQKKIVLVTGGSLGAKNINEAIAGAVDEFAANDLQLIWQTGKLFAAAAKEKVQGKSNIWTAEFINRMELAFAAADIVVSRSGAMAVAELCVVKKPVIFVPFPFAAEDHQTANAKKLANQDAAVVVTDAEVNTGLMKAIVALAKDENKQEELKVNIGRLARTDADEIIAREILKEIND